MVFVAICDRLLLLIIQVKGKMNGRSSAGRIINYWSGYNTISLFRVVACMVRMATMTSSL